MTAQAERTAERLFHGRISRHLCGEEPAQLHSGPGEVVGPAWLERQGAMAVFRQQLEEFLAPVALFCLNAGYPGLRWTGQEIGPELLGSVPPLARNAVKLRRADRKVFPDLLVPVSAAATHFLSLLVGL
jgi:hypothetical protein